MYHNCMRDYYGAHVDLVEFKTKLLQGVKVESYIISKMVFGDKTDNATFTTPRKGRKRLHNIITIIQKM